MIAKRLLLIGLMVSAQPLAAMARDVSGSLAYRERIALPDGVEMVVELAGPDGVVAELRQTPAGQVPLPFTVTTDLAPHRARQRTGLGAYPCAGRHGVFGAGRRWMARLGTVTGLDFDDDGALILLSSGDRAAVLTR